MTFKGIDKFLKSNQERYREFRNANHKVIASVAIHISLLQGSVK